MEPSQSSFQDESTVIRTPLRAAPQSYQILVTCPPEISPSKM